MSSNGTSPQSRGHSQVHLKPAQTAVVVAVAVDVAAVAAVAARVVVVAFAVVAAVAVPHTHPA